MPALTTTDEDLGEGLGILREAVADAVGAGGRSRPVTGRAMAGAGAW